MKKLGLYIFLGLIWCNVGFAKTYLDQIFGIKINDDINNYIEECNISGVGLKTEECTSLLSREFELSPKSSKYITTYLWKLKSKSTKDKEYKDYKIELKWEKNEVFKNYSLYVDRNFKTSYITAGIEVFDHNLGEFKNKCRDKKKDLIRRISKIHSIPINKFVEHIYKYTNENKKKVGTMFVDISQLDYLVNNIPVILGVYCRYKVNADFTKVKSTLVYNLSTIEFRKHNKEKTLNAGYTIEVLKKLNDEDIIMNNKGL